MSSIKFLLNQTVWKEMLFEEFQDGRQPQRPSWYWNGTILAILNLYVVSMLPIKFHFNHTYTFEGDELKEFQDGRHGGYLGYQNGMILAILTFYAASMPTIKFLLNPTYGLGECRLKNVKIAMVTAILDIGTEQFQQFWISMKPQCLPPSFSYMDWQLTTDNRPQHKLTCSKGPDEFIINLTFPLLCSMVVLVLHNLSLLTISLVTSTSASTKLLCSNAPGCISSSPLILVLFMANLFALRAAIFSRGIASWRDEDLNGKERGTSKQWSHSP